MFVNSDGTNVLAQLLDDGRVALLYDRDHAPVFPDLATACAHARTFGRVSSVDPVRYEVRTVNYEKRGGYVRAGARVAL